MRKTLEVERRCNQDSPEQSRNALSDLALPLPRSLAARIKLPCPPTKRPCLTQSVNRPPMFPPSQIRRAVLMPVSIAAQHLPRAYSHFAHAYLQQQQLPPRITTTATAAAAHHGTHAATPAPGAALALHLLRWPPSAWPGVWAIAAAIAVPGQLVRGQEMPWPAMPASLPGARSTGVWPALGNVSVHAQSAGLRLTLGRRRHSAADLAGRKHGRAAGHRWIGLDTVVLSRDTVVLSAPGHLTHRNLRVR